jgi:hypothetical protein
MTSDQKHALGVLLLVVGAIWFFFIVIWMPPLTMAVFWLAFKIGFNSVFDSVIVSRSLLYGEGVLALSAIGTGLYINLRRLMRRRQTKIVPSPKNESSV